MIGPRLTLAVVYPEGTTWGAQMYAGTAPGGTLAAYPTRAECEDATRSLLRQMGQTPPLVAVRSRAAGDAVAGALLPP